MTTEDDFQAALDAHPDDWQTRLVFADWLEEHSDPRAEGYRALGMRRARPHPPSTRRGEIRAWTWGYEKNPNNAPGSEWAQMYGMILLPTDWADLLGSHHVEDFEGTWKRFASRRLAEDTAAIAFTKLPTERRAELLSGRAPRR